jgi:hypothetical protein
MRPTKPYPDQPPYAKLSQPEFLNDRTRGTTTPAARRAAPPAACVSPTPTFMRNRSPAKLPDPWLFDSEQLLRELDRCREMVLLIPAPTNETHFAINNAVNAIWNLREQLRYLLSLHRDGQRAFAKHHKPQAEIALPAPAIRQLRVKHK